jgi:cytochrome c biogenesis protein CcdA
MVLDPRLAPAMSFRSPARLELMSKGREARMTDGCSGGLMAVLFVLGATSLFWMAFVAVAIFAEKVLPRGPQLATVFAVALVALGIWVTEPGGSPSMEMRS